MTTGLLDVTGTIDVHQFWPEGGADADTTKVHVSVGANSFRFRPHPGEPFRITQAFQNATVRGRITKAPIDNNNRITVRLQGIDAPELHYRPASILKPRDRTQRQTDLYLEWNLNFRQYQAESGTVALALLLQGAGQDPLPCKVVTAVDEPNEVFDTYARFVGDILVTIGGNEINLNTWLTQQGWVYPAFYSSMSSDEIQTLTAAADAAFAASAGVWPNLSDYINGLDWNLVYRGKNAPINAAADVGSIVLPKFFRRLTKWAVNRKAEMVTGSFLSYLRARPEYMFLTDQFVVQGPTSSQPRRLDEFVLADYYLSLWPEQMVFQEAPSRITGPGGVPVNW